jgi:hypothetical protein
MAHSTGAARGGTLVDQGETQLPRTKLWCIGEYTLKAAIDEYAVVVTSSRDRRTPVGVCRRFASCAPRVRPGRVRTQVQLSGECRLKSVMEFKSGLLGAQANSVPSWLGNLWTASALLFILAILVRLPDLDQLARFDELYTLLAARGWLSDGIPRIAEGVYSRAELYTIFVAEWLRLFGDNLVVARLPSVLCGGLLVVAVFLWTNAVAGRATAWISGLFVALSSLSVEMSQYARFYTLHALAFWLGATGVYALSIGQLPIARFRRVALAAGTIVSLLCALYVQVLTLIGIVALGLWLGLTLLLPFLAQRFTESWQKWTVGGLALTAGLVAAAMLPSDLVGGLLQRYLFVPLTHIHHQGEFWYYHLHLVERYPTLWPIFPFLAMIAVAARPRPSLFAICLFCVVFAALSFGGQKSLRYLFFALPFLYVVWAIALVSLWTVLRDAVLAATDQVAGHFGPGWQRPVRWGLIATGLAFLLFSNGEAARTLLRPLGVRLGEGFSAGWPDAVPKLQTLVDGADVVLTSYELHMLYYLKRADIVVSAERLDDFAGKEFERDARTGLPVISRPESLALILDCYPSGVLVTDTIKGWRAPTVIDEATADLVARRMTPIELPARSHMKAFYWQTPLADDLPAACASLPAPRHRAHPGNPN